MKWLGVLWLGSAIVLTGQSTSPLIGSVSGRVVDADTNMPVAGVRVEPVVGNRRVGNPSTTDADGRYHLEGLPAQKLTIRVEPDMGPSMTAPRSVTVIGGRDTPVDFRTRLFGEVSGKVVDADGKPVAGVDVTANVQEYDPRTGELLVVTHRIKATTDDRGRYVIRTIPAGRRIWIVASSRFRYATPISDAPDDPKDRGLNLASTYYPNADSIETATPVIVYSHEMRDGVDIQMRRTESFCVDATLTERGVPGAFQYLIVDRSVLKRPLADFIEFSFSSTSGSDGKIRLCDLYRGEFQLIAERRSQYSLQAIGATDVSISDKDVRGLMVSVIPRSTVSGELVLDKPQVGTAAQSMSIRIYLTPSFDPFPAALAVPSAFSLDVVTGMSFGLDVYSMDSHSYVKDVTYGGRGILHQPFIPSGADAKLRVVVGNDSGSITATVLNPDGQPGEGAAVIIVPVTARSESEIATTFVAGVTDERGMFVAKTLSPGKYDVFASNNAPPSAVETDNILLIDRTPDAIGKILHTIGRARQVEVGPNREVSVSLTPIQM